MLLLASGRGVRLGADKPKAFVSVGGVPLVVRSAQRLAQITVPRSEIILAINPEDRATHVAEIEPQLRAAGVDRIVDGGATRQQSMQNAFAACPPADVVLVHDAARPFFDPALVELAIARAHEISGGALLAARITDTLKRVAAGDRVVETLDRSGVWAAQTPQVATWKALQTALRQADEAGFAATDDVSLLEHAEIAVEVVESTRRNLKVTTLADLALAEHYAAQDARSTDHD